MNGRLNNNLILQHCRSFGLMNWLGAHTEPYRPASAIWWSGLFASPRLFVQGLFIWMSSVGYDNLYFLMGIIGYFSPPHLLILFVFITMIISCFSSLYLPSFHSIKKQKDVFGDYLYIWLRSCVCFSYLNINFLSLNIKNTTLFSSQNCFRCIF